MKNGFDYMMQHNPNVSNNWLRKHGYSMLRKSRVGKVEVEPVPNNQDDREKLTEEEKKEFFDFLLGPGSVIKEVQNEVKV